MHPARRPARRARGRFLRARGDAPLAEGLLAALGTVPPRTRRCTSRATPPVISPCGFLLRTRRCTLQRFAIPRSRNSVPPRTRRCTLRRAARRLVRPWVPPRTRRCTRSLTVPGVVDAPRASSAHAEMHPASGSGSAASGRFLRARGDAPAETPIQVHGWPVPPRTRRCTRGARHRARQARGSSAHAETHLRWGMQSARGSRFLRAHAEMHPLGKMRATTVPWFLRARGDAPRRSSTRF